jgi:hypothetical protein
MNFLIVSRRLSKNNIDTIEAFQGSSQSLLQAVVISCPKILV